MSNIVSIIRSAIETGSYDLSSMLETMRQDYIRTERAKRARDQEVGNDSEENENIASFLKAMNPADSDLEDLFEEGGGDAEEAEETGEV